MVLTMNLPLLLILNLLFLPTATVLAETTLKNPEGYSLKETYDVCTQIRE